jgi:hypothetical protein
MGIMLLPVVKKFGVRRASGVLRLAVDEDWVYL